MISYDGWDREYQENKEVYLALFDKFMSESNYENNESFDNQFADFIGRKHAVTVASATDALHFSLLAHNIGRGDEVLVTDFSWIASVSCVEMAGATPVFCDIDLNSYHMDIDSVRRMYSDKTKAVVYVHLFGNMIDTTELQAFCKEKDILFIEDAAQSLGSSLNDIKAGTIGDCSVYSFNSNKVIAGINGGGVVLTDNEEIANRIKMIRRHGRDSDFAMLGYNSKMYVLNAEIIKLRLFNMEPNQIARQAIAAKYSDAFKNLPVYIQRMTPGLNHNYHKYTLRFDNNIARERVKTALCANIHYGRPISLNSKYNSVVFRKDNCVTSKLVADTIMSLPIHAWLTESETDTIISIVKSEI